MRGNSDGEYAKNSKTYKRVFEKFHAASRCKERGAQNRSLHVVNEDSSTTATQQMPPKGTFQTPSKAFLIQSLIVLAMVSGSVSYPAWGAILTQNSLKGIELNSTPLETKIILRSDSRIPYRVISKNQEKIVIDLDSVDPLQSIQTDFASAENIEHVVLKPVGTSKLRMVIRGEKLSTPVVTSISLPATKPANPLFEQESQRSSMGHEVSPSAVVNVPDENSVSPPSKEEPGNSVNPASTDEISNSSEKTALSSSPETEEASLQTEEGSSEIFSSDKPFLINEDGDPDSGNSPMELMSDREPISLTDDSEEAISTEENANEDIVNEVIRSVIAFVKAEFSRIDRKTAYQLCMFSGLALLAGLLIRKRFSRRKVFSLEAKENFFSSFWAWLSGRNPGKTEAAQKNVRNGERPVGLSGLSSGRDIINPTLLPKSRSLLNLNQAINQYSKNATSPLPEYERRDSKEIDYQLQRSIHSRQATSKTHSRKNLMKPNPIAQELAKSPVKKQQPIKRPITNKSPEPAKPTGSNQYSNRETIRKPVSQPMTGGLPPGKPQPFAGRKAEDTVKSEIFRAAMTSPSETSSSSPISSPKGKGSFSGSPFPSKAEPKPGLPANNSEVLDFLRSVAELMEKDGKSSLTKSNRKIEELLEQNNKDRRGMIPPFER